MACSLPLVAPPRTDTYDPAMDDSVVVYTDVRSDEIIREGGLGDWVLDPERASACKFLVCCRKERWSNVDEGVPKRAAFLIGRIKKFAPKAANSRGQRRFFIEISDYVLTKKTDVWQDWRNPVRYDSLKRLGFSQAALKFQSVPVRSKRQPSKAAPMTIEQAKKALADSLGISPDQIEITIRS